MTLKTYEKILVILTVLFGTSLMLCGDLFGTVLIGIGFGYAIARVEG
jgi:hypothetical protein